MNEWSWKPNKDEWNGVVKERLFREDWNIDESYIAHQGPQTCAKSPLTESKRAG